jgi:phage N-6-adenine-methyltransferase
MTMTVHYSSLTNEWSTPAELFARLDAEFGFTLDPCATAENAKCRKFFSQADDGLRQSWAGERVFMNPPYGRQIGAWVRRRQPAPTCGECRYFARYLDGTFCDRRAIWRLRTDQACNIGEVS